MTAHKTVARGYVLIMRDPSGVERLSAVVSGPDAVRIKRKHGGRIVSAKGLRYRVAQGSLRVIVEEDRPTALARETVTP